MIINLNFKHGNYGNGKGKLSQKNITERKIQTPYLVFQNKQPGSKFQIKNDSPVRALI